MTFIRLEGNLVVNSSEILRAEFHKTVHSCFLDITLKSGPAHGRERRYRDTEARAIWRAIEARSLPSGKFAEGSFLARLCSVMRM